MTNPVTVTGNTFGGSATSVILTHNGLGTLTPTSTSTSPFSFTYTPSVSDIGQTRTITVTTNNPLGSPCIPTVMFYEIIVNANPTVAITSSNSPMCVNNTRSLTGTPAGGTWSVSGPATLSGNSVLATGAGNIIITYTVTSNGCTGSSSQTIVSNITPSTPVANIVCSNGTGTINVTAPTGAGYEYSINGTTWQGSNTFSGLANNTYTIYARLNGCTNSTTVAVNCQSCACTASIAITTDCSMSLTQNCTGYSWTWQESINGTSGWTNVQTNGSSYSGVSGRFYRVVLTKATCTDVITNIVNPSCPCLGFSMSVTPVTGGVSFGTLNFNGTPLTNYQIQWRRCSDNSVVFTSGMGTGSGTGIYPHPSSNIPLIGDCYYPYIVSSSQGNNLNCFPQFTVQNWTCANPPSYSYNGPGGAASTREFRMDITPSLAYIVIGNYYVATVPDLLEVIYNGVTIYSGSVNLNQHYIPITYVTGVNYVTFRITNSNPSVNTIWSIDGVRCCTALQPCPTIADVPLVTAPSSSLSTECGCLLNTNINTAFDKTCRKCEWNLNNANINVGDCVTQITDPNNTCVNGSVTITKTAGANRILTFASASMYNTVKAYIQGTPSTKSVYIIFKNQNCASDGTIVGINFWPLYATVTYDDVNLVINITINANPFPDDCINCNKLKRNLYATMFINFSSAVSISTVLSLTGLGRVAYVQNTVNQIYDFSSTIVCTTYPCTVTLTVPYRWFIRDVNCPCQSWQLFRDTNNDGIYETLVNEASGWTGTCL